MTGQLDIGRLELSQAAAVQAVSFRKVVEKHPRIGSFTELPGRVTFQPDGTTVWGMGCEHPDGIRPAGAPVGAAVPERCLPVKGPWHQARVAIQSGPHGAVDDLWLRRAKDFPIRASVLPARRRSIDGAGRERLRSRRKDVAVHARLLSHGDADQLWVAMTSLNTPYRCVRRSGNCADSTTITSCPELIPFGTLGRPIWGCLE